MHNHYYFLRKLSKAVEKQLAGFTLVSCFSQNKDELVVEFNNAAKSFFVKASLQGDFQCLSFPTTFHRARKNSVDLFNSLLMKKVVGVRQFENERSFGIVLEDDHTLVFKMHGARANVLHFDGEGAKEIFRNNFTADETLILSELDRAIDWSQHNFEHNRDRLQEIYFTFGKPIWNYLRSLQFDTLDHSGQWNLIQSTLKQLDHPEYRLVDRQGAIALSLIPEESVLEIYKDPIIAINDFFIRHISTAEFRKEKISLLSQVEGKLKQSGAFLEKTRAKFLELQQDAKYQQWADLIMANLNNIKTGEEKVELENFYDQQRIVIKLKRELTPQKNAEVYYRKAKNQSIELKKLEESIQKKEQEILSLTNWKDQIESSRHMNDLKSISTTLTKALPSQRDQVALPYHEFEFKGFKILVGKNAAANDTLTMKHSFKDDLWLHAKDVPGSHVLIKYQSGKPFPKDVIEHAAQMAAYYSKRKNETLCPVAVTPKKFVRKRKGDPAGTVVVEREEVLMVEPGDGR